ncbi:SDR family oxidoreductase [Streptomyces sp. MK5]|uniref:SDR family NAD(P)-dependent oxidoreductase n=1 Tax=Streptomyces sp. MK5 TaxID=3064253 RepID=UPI002740368E|nr:SDR family NAD(P)-dependent oxidoreductase [Streptomyces sp. MK5]
MYRNLAEQRILITGASSGIGRALAKALALKGAHLAVAARTETALHELADDITRAGGRRPVILVTDLSLRGNAEQLAQRALAELGRVDVLINNAGVGCFGFQWNVGDGDEAREVYETNFWSPLALVRSLVPHMRERGTGLVINVSSLMQLRTWPGLGYYASSKSALAAVTETLRLELQNSDIDVMELLPGPVDTQFLSESAQAPGAGHILRNLPIGTTDALAVAAVRAIEKGKRRLVYPGKLVAALYLPMLVRYKAARTVRKAGSDIDRNDRRVLRSGSNGDPIAQQARADWVRAKRAS